jgi:hypothetical protein
MHLKTSIALDELCRNTPAIHFKNGCGFSHRGRLLPELGVDHDVP